jgi:hypothetical protein
MSRSSRTLPLESSTMSCWITSSPNDALLGQISVCPIPRRDFEYARCVLDLGGWVPHVWPVSSIVHCALHRHDYLRRVFNFVSAAKLDGSLWFPASFARLTVMNVRKLWHLRSQACRCRKHALAHGSTPEHLRKCKGFAHVLAVRGWPRPTKSIPTMSCSRS